MHSDYKGSPAHENDVAILLFDHAFEMNKYVRPVCLWKFDYHLSIIINKTAEA